MKILIAEDDEYLCEGLSMGLEHRGHSVDCVHSGLEAKGAMSEARYDLLLLDLGLPDIDGIKVLRDLRKNGFTLPIMIITARDGIEDKISGLDQGANDYITKPFDFRELDSRIRAILRSTCWENKSQLTIGRLRFDTATREVFLDDNNIKLTPGEVAILEALLQRFGRLVSKRDLIDRLSKWDTSPSENAIEIIIHRLRRKLEPADVSIRTARGFGYLLEKRHDTLDT